MSLGFHKYVSIMGNYKTCIFLFMLFVEVYMIWRLRAYVSEINIGYVMLF